MSTFLLSLALAAQASQFDLVCNGDAIDTDGNKSPFHLELRVDLAAKLYCEGSCDDTTKIFAVNDHYIIFTNYESGDSTLWLSVDRRTGAYDETMAVPPSRSSRSGNCVRAPFKGFPRHRTKF